MRLLTQFGTWTVPLIGMSFAQVDEIEDLLEALVVIGSGETKNEFVEPPALAGSKDIITLDELEYEHPTDTLELFSKIPGVNLARYNQGIINTDVGIRGFGTDGVTPHAKTLIDGVPMNLHNGYNELDQMFSMGIGSIEVYKGTSDLRYGLYNVAGSYNVYSRTDLTSEVQVTLDSFGSYEGQFYSGSQVGNLTQNYFLGYRDAEGYRDHDNTQKYTFSGRWAYEVDDSLTLGASARFSGYEGDAPGYLSKSAARNDRTSSADYSQNDYGEKVVNSFSLFADKDFYDAGIQLSIKAYYNDFSRERIVDFGYGLRDRTDDLAAYGLIANLNWDLTDAVSLKAGIDFQRQDYQERYLRVSSLGGPITRVDSDHDYTFDNAGGYLGVEYDSGHAFRANAGVRIDSLDGEGLVGNRRGITSQSTDLNIIYQPKVNLFYDITTELTAFAHYGRTFQAPLRADLFSGNSPNINDGGEVGLMYHFSDRSSVRLSLWQQVAENEYQLDQFNGGYVELGEVERRGVELAFSYDLTEALNLWGNYGYTMSEIKDDSAGFPGTKGNELRGTPNHTYSLGASYDVNEALIVRISLDGQGGYYINEANLGGQFGDYNVVSMGLDYDTGYGTLSFQVNNFFDAKNEYVYDFSQDASSSVHSPFDGVNASVSYKYEF